MSKNPRFDNSKPASGAPSTSSLHNFSSSSHPTITQPMRDTWVRPINPPSHYLAPPALAPRRAAPLDAHQVTDFCRVTMAPDIPPIPLPDEVQPSGSGQRTPSPPPMASSSYACPAATPSSRPPSNPQFSQVAAPDLTGQARMDARNSPRPSAPTPDRRSSASTSAQSPPPPSLRVKAVSPGNSSASSHWSSASSTLVPPSSSTPKIVVSPGSSSSSATVCIDPQSLKDAYAGPSSLGKSVYNAATRAHSPPLKPPQRHGGSSTSTHSPPPMPYHHASATVGYHATSHGHAQSPPQHRQRDDSVPNAKLPESIAKMRLSSPTPSTGRSSLATTTTTTTAPATSTISSLPPVLHPFLREGIPQRTIDLSSYTSIKDAIPPIAWRQSAAPPGVSLQDMTMRVQPLTWPLHVTPARTPSPTLTRTPIPSIPRTPSPGPTRTAPTVGDVFRGLYRSLHGDVVPPTEFARLGERRKREVLEALEGRGDSVLRPIDLMGPNTVFRGLEWVRQGEEGVWRMQVARRVEPVVE